MKKVFLMLVAVVALAACQKSAPTPTGDAEKDAKAVVEYVAEKVKSCKTEDDLKKIEGEMETLFKEFEEYAKNNPEYEKAFDKAAEKNSAELMAVIFEAAAKIEKEKK